MYLVREYAVSDSGHTQKTCDTIAEANRVAEDLNGRAIRLKFPQRFCVVPEGSAAESESPAETRVRLADWVETEARFAKKSAESIRPPPTAPARRKPPKRAPVVAAPVEPTRSRDIGGAEPMPVAIPPRIAASPVPSWAHRSLAELGIATPALVTKGTAKKLQREGAKRCGCFLCSTALNPPLTFAAHQLIMDETYLHNVEIEQRAGG